MMDMESSRLINEWTVILGSLRCMGPMNEWTGLERQMAPDGLLAGYGWLLYVFQKNIKKWHTIVWFVKMLVKTHRKGILVQIMVCFALSELRKLLKPLLTWSWPPSHKWYFDQIKNSMKFCNAVVHNIFGWSQPHFTLSWHVQNFVVIG